MAGKAARKADEQRGAARGVLPVLVFLVAVREIDPDADDLFRVRQRDQEADILLSCVGRATIGGGASPVPAPRREHLLQGP